MIISLWRYSHLSLAISSFLLLTIASVTGIFLAFEPVIEKSQGYRADGFDTVSLAHIVPLAKAHYPGIEELSVDDNDYVVVKYAGEKGDQQAYINPVTGEMLGIPQVQSPFFQWMTSMHRSLFMHETGRIIIGVTAFLLILIVVSGIMLVVQRQQGWRRFFSTVEQTGFAQYYHVVFGRIALFFILIIAVSGAYLAVYRFVPPPIKAALSVKEDTIREEPLLPPEGFPVFQQTHLSELKKLQYPFSDFPEDYYSVQLKSGELCINQFTGDILASESYPAAYRLANFSLRWHTGRSGMVWALVLALSAGYILFFIYSGFVITLKRRRSRSGNKFKAGEARVVILVGSENGSTFRFADAVYKQLLKGGEKVFLTDISNWQLFPCAQQMIIMTSTYGQGDAPSNARKIEDRLKKYPQQQPIGYSIVGFGSRSYTWFCKFAYDAEALLQSTSWAKPVLPVYTVNDKSPQDFSAWLTAWTAQTGYKMMLPRELLAPDAGTLRKLTVVDKTEPDTGDVFMVKFDARRLKQAVSGDLLAIYPKNDHRERLYSIGKINRDIQLSIKLHEHGLGSGFLNALKRGDAMQAKLIKNQHFRFPGHAPKIIMVSNGTGIAPFLGMLSENKRKIPVELYCGFREQASFTLYETFLAKQISEGKLTNVHLALSRQGDRIYVSHLIRQHSTAVAAALQEGAVLMICGSLSMQKDVLEVLDQLCVNKTLSLAALIEQRSILTDCY